MLCHIHFHHTRSHRVLQQTSIYHSRAVVSPVSQLYDPFRCNWIRHKAIEWYYGPIIRKDGRCSLTLCRNESSNYCLSPLHSVPCIIFSFPFYPLRRRKYTCSILYLKSVHAHYTSSCSVCSTNPILGTHSWTTRESSQYHIQFKSTTKSDIYAVCEEQSHGSLCFSNRFLPNERFDTTLRKNRIRVSSPFRSLESDPSSKHDPSRNWCLRFTEYDFSSDRNNALYQLLLQYHPSEVRLWFMYSNRYDTTIQFSLNTTIPASTVITFSNFTIVCSLEKSSLDRMYHGPNYYPYGWK